MKQSILLGAVLAGVVLPVLGIDGVAGRAITLVVVVLILLRAKQSWRRRRPTPITPAT